MFGNNYFPTNQLIKFNAIKIIKANKSGATDLNVGMQIIYVLFSYSWYSSGGQSRPPQTSSSGVMLIQWWGVKPPQHPGKSNTSCARRTYVHTTTHLSKDTMSSYLFVRITHNIQYSLHWQINSFNRHILLLAECLPSTSKQVPVMMTKFNDGVVNVGLSTQMRNAVWHHYALYLTWSHYDRDITEICHSVMTQLVTACGSHQISLEPVTSAVLTGCLQMFDSIPVWNAMLLEMHVSEWCGYECLESACAMLGC